MEGGVDACLNGTAGGAVCHVSADIACICVWGGDRVATISVFSAVSILAPIYMYMYSTCTTTVYIRAYVFHHSVLLDSISITALW